jgi:hypothetical protein
MSDLLNSASLVMIPSGYKEDVVYSAVPTDGSGDLSFTRASNGTRINSAGLVEVTPWNLIEQSETFDNAIWNLYYGTITSNSQTAPNGTLTADTLTSSTQQYSGIYQSLGTLPTNVYTYSIYVKAGTNNFFGMLGQGTGSQIAIFNLSTGVVSSISNLDSASIENVGNGWYRCQIQKTGVGVEMLIFSSNIANSTPTASGTVFIWGAQTNIGSTAKPYFPTTDRLNVPRLTYQNGGGGCPSLLLEKQSTNLLIYSEQFDQWSTNSTTTVNAGISPDGTQNADRLNFTSGSVYWLDAGVSVTNGVSYTYSLYVKPTSVGNQFRFYLDGAFNDSTVITTDSSDWKRYTWTFTASATGSINPHVLLGYGYSSQSILAWGAQLEASSYPTSYISTTSASATRVADACSKTGISSLIGQTEGVLFADFSTFVGANDDRQISINDGSISNRVTMALLTNGTQIQFVVQSGGSIVMNTTQTIATLTTRVKIAYAYKLNDFAIYVNGVSVATDTNGAVPISPSVLSFDAGDSTDKMLGKVNQVALFPTRLTNAELASLTTI